MMRTITIQYPDGSQHVYATNENGRGLFYFEAGAYKQMQGNLDTPRFHTRQQFRRYIGQNTELPAQSRLIASFNWADLENG